MHIYDTRNYRCLFGYIILSDAKATLRRWKNTTSESLIESSDGRFNLKECIKMYLFNSMQRRRKNRPVEILLVGVFAITFAVRGTSGILYEQASVLTRGTTPAHYLNGQSAVLLALVYIGFTGVFIGYLFRFSRWRNLIFASIFLLWLCIVVGVLIKTMR